jgi:hypothetical protein
VRVGRDFQEMIAAGSKALREAADVAQHDGLLVREPAKGRQQRLARGSDPLRGPAALCAPPCCSSARALLSSSAS